MVVRRKILATAKFASVIDLEGFKILNDGQVECAGTLQRLELGPHSARESVGDIQGSRFELSSRTTVFLLKNTTEEVTQVHCQRSRRGWGDIQHPSFPILLRTARLEEIFAPQKLGTCPGMGSFSHSAAFSWIRTPQRKPIIDIQARKHPALRKTTPHSAMNPARRTESLSSGDRVLSTGISNPILIKVLPKFWLQRSDKPELRQNDGGLA